MVGSVPPLGARPAGPRTSWSRCGTAGRRTGERRAQRGLPPRRSAAPLPPWLGGGPSKAVSGYTVVAGDTLWDIAAAHLPPAERSVGRVHHYWQQVYRANRRVVGADPDLIHQGTRLDVLSFRSDQ
jgi:nucleoid-associated protein YgaU